MGVDRKEYQHAAKSGFLGFLLPGHNKIPDNLPSPKNHFLLLAKLAQKFNK